VSDIIRLLPDSVANQIAAGEVIQRPASVVKELVENALDAGAAEILVHIKDAGKTLIQITDNGNGMSPTDARMAFERHATSKIRSANDLFAIRTMGFRGEALASVAAIADVELRTKQQGDETGTFLHINATRVIVQEPVACNNGTSIQVKNLFFNVPARRKFLKSDATEIKLIIHEVQRVAIPNPDISFYLYHNGTSSMNCLRVI
jgi:DNA mismatch repair protein MutL